jgi:hypothetical protein
MAVSRIKTSSVLQGFPKSRSLLAGNPPFTPSSFESIATIANNSGYFTSIPQTYKHLQFRMQVRSSFAGTDQLWVTLNGNGSGYARHYLQGNGSSATAVGATSQAGVLVEGLVGSTAAANIFTTVIIDIQDYTSTTRNKTVRVFSGTDLNGSGTVLLTSGFVADTSALTTVNIDAYNGGLGGVSGNLISLYGIK